MDIGKHVENNSMKGCELGFRGMTVLNFKIHNLPFLKVCVQCLAKLFSMTWTEKLCIECPGKLKCLNRILSSTFLMSVKCILKITLVLTMSLPPIRWTITCLETARMYATYKLGPTLK